GERLYVTHFRSGRLSEILIPAFAVARVISTGADTNVSQAIWIEDGRAWLPATRSLSQNRTLTFETTLLPIIAVVDLDSGQNLVKERLDLQYVDRPSSLPIDMVITSTGKMVLVYAGSDDVAIIDVAKEKSIAHHNTGSNPRGVVVSPD